MTSTQREARAFLTTRVSSFVTLLVALLIAVAPAYAEDEKELGWSFVGELSLVLAEGNAEATSAGFNLAFTHAWEDADFVLNLSGLQVETGTTTRLAVGTIDAFRIIEDSSTETTAENYAINGRYDRKISERLFWYTGAGWERNEFAGFDSRFNVVGGVGHNWFETDTAHFKTYYGLTYTSQDDLIENLAIDDGWVGIQLGYDYGRSLTDNTTFASTLVVDTNLDESEDVRADFLNSLAVSMTDALALKVSLQLRYDNLPALVEIPLFDNANALLGSVLGELDELDSILSVALVLKR